MTLEKTFSLNKRTQRLQSSENGRVQWDILTTEQVIPAGQTAILICDMWDRHWSRGASERVETMAPRLNEVVQVARQTGAWVIHAPSETLTFYEQSPARQRIRDLKQVKPPRSRKLPDPRLPIDDSMAALTRGRNPGFAPGLASIRPLTLMKNWM